LLLSVACHSRRPGSPPSAARRRLLGALAGIVAGLPRLVAASGAAWAQATAKISQHDAHYQLVPKDGRSCALCTLFRPPHACAVVEGNISPQGWCKFFDLPD
jgi:hypothetical protein